MKKITSCGVTGCSESPRSKGLCQAHGKQRSRKPTSPCKPLRPRSTAPEGTVPFMGLMLLPTTVEAVGEAAVLSQESPRYVVARAVDGWARGRAWTPRRARAAVGKLAATVVVLACLNIFCVGPNGARRTADEEELTKPIPKKALPGQPLGPTCPQYMEVREGSCWLPFRLPSGKQLRDCKDSESLYEDSEGYCWTPGVPLKKKQPNAVEP